MPTTNVLTLPPQTKKDNHTVDALQPVLTVNAAGLPHVLIPSAVQHPQLIRVSGPAVQQHGVSLSHRLGVPYNCHQPTASSARVRRRGGMATFPAAYQAEGHGYAPSRHLVDVVGGCAAASRNHWCGATDRPMQWRRRASWTALRQ